ncbi:4039_t:CDS:2, partial [Acaulospora colombiana]
SSPTAKESRDPAGPIKEAEEELDVQIELLIPAQFNALSAVQFKPVESTELPTPDALR